MSMVLILNNLQLSLMLISKSQFFGEDFFLENYVFRCLLPYYFLSIILCTHIYFLSYIFPTLFTRRSSKMGSFHFLSFPNFVWAWKSSPLPADTTPCYLCVCVCVCVLLSCSCWDKRERKQITAAPSCLQW